MSAATLKTVDLRTIQPGDVVAGAVIDLLRNNLPPVLDWSNLFQAGGAVTDRLLPNGSLRTAYSTFRRIGKDTWEYCGACLRGESTERGQIPPWYH